MAVTWEQVSTQRENLRVELERSAETAERNTGLQGLVASESERRKKVLPADLMGYTDFSVVRSLYCRPPCNPAVYPHGANACSDLRLSASQLHAAYYVAVVWG